MHPSKSKVFANKKCSDTEAYLMFTSVNMIMTGLFLRAGGQINGWVHLKWAGGNHRHPLPPMCILIATHYDKLCTAIVLFRGL